MPVYVDASAAVKLLIVENGSDSVAALWEDADVLLASQLVYPEVRAGLAAAARADRIDAGEADAQAASWELLWTEVATIDVTGAIAGKAGLLAERFALRGADAVHLASALAVASPDLVVAVWDRRLHASAIAAGLQVVPARL